MLPILLAESIVGWFNQSLWKVTLYLTRLDSTTAILSHFCPKWRSVLQIVTSIFRQEHPALCSTIKCLSVAVLREIFRSRITASRRGECLGLGIWNSRFREDERLFSKGAVARGLQPPRIGIYVRRLRVFAREHRELSQHGRDDGRAQRGRKAEEWNDRVMPDCRLLFQLDKPDPDSDRIHPCSPQFRESSLLPLPFRSNRPRGGSPRRRRMHDHEDVARLGESDFLTRRDRCPRLRSNIFPPARAIIWYYQLNLSDWFEPS